MKKVLILGGTRFFGKRLVEQLISEQVDITIVTRGYTSDSFGSSVKRLQVDRTDPIALRNALGSSTFDLVYDNICFTPQEAEDAVELLAGRVGKYIVTSSLSVYPFGEPRKKESDVDSYRYPLPVSYPPKEDYAEGKRLVEAVLFQKAPFKVAAVRFPIVLGLDDYTRRLHFHVEHIQQGLPLGIPNLTAPMSFIRSDEAASFLAWLGSSNLEGPVNACSQGEVSIGQIVSLISQATGRQANVFSETEEVHMSPFGIPESWYMDTTKAQAAGYSFQKLGDWLPELIREIVVSQTR
ncbi:NAD-dependent epimerase/dehydratase family protein [Paenibacillus sp. SYP-B3998]|uniref:NAD-dependent epimerase/dehydratase family protein n=1 Tax=Paenibacillus sp. SYP-B3998 TaxID=2678564 RepID=A0A6G3ZYP3_9BACL|nr:NAD-dependent epimerase/dehydratase family protein [Paenibacillus sp. SYP-B3998]NEW07333.1 NAD-dependent epimerase/dehydratase family protein [Paenibacillus sp. SYP-B3998]